jgi:hypothetical protein
MTFEPPHVRHAALARARQTVFNRLMARSHLLRYSALCCVALACRTQAPEGPLATAAPPAAELAEDGPSPTMPGDAIATESPAPEPAPTPTGAPSVAAAASSDGPGGLGTPGGLGARAPKVRLQAIVVESSTIDADILHRIIRQRALDLRDCYLPRLAKRPELEGQLHFRLWLGGNGDVTNVEVVVNTLGDAEALSCVKAIMHSLVLPGPAEPPAVIVVPLMFSP